MTEGWLTITVGIIFVNNYVLSQFLGICPFLGVSRKLRSAIGMSSAVIFVMTLASLITSLIYNYAFKTNISFTIFGHCIKGNLIFLQTLVFIAVIASLVQMVELVLRKISQPLYKALGVFLPLITTNCAILACVVINANKNRSVLHSVVYSFCAALGFSLALILFASLREKLDLANVPKPMQGTAIALITAGILAMGFMGFTGLTK